MFSFSRNKFLFSKQYQTLLVVTSKIIVIYRLNKCMFFNVLKYISFLIVPL